MNAPDSINRRTSLKRLGAVIAGTALSGSFFSTHSFGQSEGALSTATDAQSERMAEIARQFMRAYEVPGLSVAIARQGQFVYRQAFGMADSTQGEKLTTDHLFRIASVTKPLTSVTIFSLVEQGRLNLSDPVFGPSGILKYDYAASFSDYVERIKVEHLLTHTSGGWGNDNHDPMFLDARMNHTELIQYTLKNFPLQEIPGRKFIYSNFGYCLLGRILEKITGQDYASVVRREILEKCGVRDMKIAGNTLADRAPGEVVYNGQKGDDPYNFNIRRMDSHGGWIATPSDLVQFALHVDGFSQTPNILKKSTIEVMSKASAACETYAKGWSVNTEPNWWHSGILPGTSTIMVRTGTGLCWAAFVNTHVAGIDGALDRMVWDLAHTVPLWKA